MTLTELDAIEARNEERREFRHHLPTGPYLYDSMGYVYNELAMTPEDGRWRSRNRTAAGLLVRSQEWFKAVAMDERLTKADGVGRDLGQYIALALDSNIEADIAALVAEVRKLRAQMQEDHSKRL